VALAGATGLVVLAVLLWLTGGSPPTRVPRVVGLTQAEAEMHLRNAQLRAALRTADVAVRCHPGYVTHQSPAAGAVADQNSSVRLTICRR
jgi:beta-lactam-binding protein with PASTA domain